MASAYPRGDPEASRRVRRSYGFSTSLTPVGDTLLAVADGFAATLTYYAVSDTARPAAVRTVPLPLARTETPGREEWAR